jgi:sulfite exporter TauE/SafE
MALHDVPKPEGKLARSSEVNLVRLFGLGSLVIALVVGIQLGSIPWRYRRQIWQVQGFLLGAVAGYVLGRLNESPGKKDN